MAKGLLGAIVLLLVFGGFQNCGMVSSSSSENASDGTETGNAHGVFGIASGISTMLCTRISACHPQLSEEDCVHQVFVMPGLPAKLGITDPSIADLQTLDGVENKRLINGSLNNYLACVPQLEGIECTDTAMTTLTLPLSVNMVENLLPASGACAQIF